jgi:hypothetical protein
MEKVLSIKDYTNQIKTYLIDLLLISFIYFLPALSHLVAFPIYYLDPMRIALVITLAHTTKRNSYLIALTLPLFSFIISSHPQIIKSLLISVELLINLTLFFMISKRIKNVFISLSISIILSKIVYYAAKYFIVKLSLINDSVFSTPIYYQLIVAILLSGYLYFVRNKVR